MQSVYVTPIGVQAIVADPAAIPVIHAAVLAPASPPAKTALKEGWVAPDRRGSLAFVAALIPKAPPRPLVRYAATGRKPGPLQPEVKRVYDALVTCGECTTPQLLAACPGMVINTLRYATQLLRQMGVVKTIK